MNGIFYLIGFIFRFPIFLLGMVAWSGFGIPVALLIILFRILVLPFKFIGAAFRNDKTLLGNYVENIFEFFPWLLDTYGSIYRWLLKTEKKVGYFYLLPKLSGKKEKFPTIL